MNQRMQRMHSYVEHGRAILNINPILIPCVATKKNKGEKHQLEFRRNLNIQNKTRHHSHTYKISIYVPNTYGRQLQNRLLHKHKIGVRKSNESNLWARHEKKQVRGKAGTRSQVDNAVNLDCTAQSSNHDQDTNPKLQIAFSNISFYYVSFSKKIQRRLPKSTTADSNLKTANQNSNWKLAKSNRTSILTLSNAFWNPTCE